ncbi:unnamed protein product [Symbiodinium natans]|uniref:CSD domain-containing protein n=1 Tax=Symbiodinium natans TaxID=878477 RepID=A0A812NLY0_9DINO|nr:unnamed protein product [Symbiodinium natans]
MLGQKRPYDPGGYEAYGACGGCGGWHDAPSPSTGSAESKKPRSEPAAMTPDEAEFFRLTGIKPERWKEQVEEVQASHGQPPGARAEVPTFPAQVTPESMPSMSVAAESPSPVPSLPTMPQAAMGMPPGGLSASQWRPDAVGEESFAPASSQSVFGVPPVAAVNELGMAQQMLLGQMMQQQMMMQMMSQSAGFGQPQDEVKEEDPLNPDNDPNRFSGRIKGFYEIASGGGYGFIDCEAARIKYGRDVYLHSRQMGDAKVGELISFTIVRNAKGEPQARNVMRAEEAMALKAKIQARERREQEQKKQKHQALEKVTVAEKRTGVMTEEEAKRFQASLRKNRQ